MHGTATNDPKSLVDRFGALFRGRRLLDMLAVAIVLVIAASLGIRALVSRHSSPQLIQDVPLPVLGGGTFRLSADRGHVVFLDFWASWCTPCQQSLPLVEAYSRRNPHVRVVDIDVGEPIPIGAEFARAHGLRNVAFDVHQQLAGANGVVGFPTIIAVDPRGHEQAKWTGFNPAIASLMTATAENWSFAKFEGDRRR